MASLQSQYDALWQDFKTLVKASEGARFDMDTFTRIGLRHRYMQVLQERNPPVDLSKLKPESADV